MRTAASFVAAFAATALVLWATGLYDAALADPTWEELLRQLLFS